MFDAPCGSRPWVVRGACALTLAECTTLFFFLGGGGRDKVPSVALSSGDRGGSLAVFVSD